MASRGSYIAIAGLVVLSLLVPGQAGAAEWQQHRLPFSPRYDGDHEFGPMLAISCPTKSFCVTGGQTGKLAVSTNPAGAGSEWNVFYVPEGSDYNGPPPPPGAPEILGGPSVRGVSCPSTRLCIAVSANGDIYSSTDPGGGTLAWSRADIDGEEFDTHLEGVSCPTVTFCVAVSGGRKSNNNPRTSGKILSSTNPTGGSAAWQVTQLDPSFDLRGVSCSSPTLCVAVGQDGRMVVSTEPGGGPSAWHDAGTPGGPGHLQGVACALGPLCIAGTSGGNLLSSTDPGGNPGSWAERNGGGSVAITAASCLPTSQCVAVDNNGDVISSNAPTGGSSAWSFQNVIPYVPTPGFEPTLNGMFGVSCPSSALCAIAAADGVVVTSTNPFEVSPAPAKRGKKVRLPRRPRTILAQVDGKRTETYKRGLRVKFRFYAIGKARRFICKRDRRPYRSCSSPVRFWAGLGKHVFRVRAIGLTGLEGQVAAERFTIYGPGKAPHITGRSPGAYRPGDGLGSAIDP